MDVDAFSGAVHSSQFERIYGNVQKPVEETLRYASLLTDKIDITLFSV